MEKSQPILPLRVLSGSIDMQQQQSVLMSITHITTKDHTDVPALACCLRTYMCKCYAELSMSLTSEDAGEQALCLGSTV